MGNIVPSLTATSDNNPIHTSSNVSGLPLLVVPPVVGTATPPPQPLTGWNVELTIQEPPPQQEEDNDNNDDHRLQGGGLWFRTGPGDDDDDLLGGGEAAAGEEEEAAAPIVKVRVKKTCGLFAPPNEEDDYLGYLYNSNHNNNSNDDDLVVPGGGVPGIIVNSTATRIQKEGEWSYLSFYFGDDIQQNSNIFTTTTTTTNNKGNDDDDGSSNIMIATIHFCIEVGLFDNHRTTQQPQQKTMRRRGYAEALFTYEMERITSNNYSTTRLMEYKTIQSCSTSTNNNQKKKSPIPLGGARCVKSYHRPQKKKKKKGKKNSVVTTTTTTTTRTNNMRIRQRKQEEQRSTTSSAAADSSSSLLSSAVAEPLPDAAAATAVVRFRQPLDPTTTTAATTFIRSRRDLQQGGGVVVVNDIVFEFPKPTSGAGGGSEQFVHGLCVMGASSASATAICDSTTSTLTYSIATEQSFGNGIKLWNDRDYVVDSGVTSTDQCMGGIYLRPSRHKLGLALLVDQIVGTDLKEHTTPQNEDTKEFLGIKGGVKQDADTEHLYEPHVVSFVLIEDQGKSYLAVLFNEATGDSQYKSSAGTVNLVVSGDVEGKLFHADSDKGDDTSNYPEMYFSWVGTWADAFVLGPYTDQAEVCTTFTQIKEGLGQGARFVNADGTATTLIDNSNDMIGVPICIPINSSGQNRRSLLNDSGNGGVPGGKMYEDFCIKGKNAWVSENGALSQTECYQKCMDDSQCMSADFYQTRCHISHYGIEHAENFPACNIWVKDPLPDETINHSCEIKLTATPADPNVDVTICGMVEDGHQERHGDWPNKLTALGFKPSEPFAWGGHSHMKAYCSSDITAAPTPAPTPAPTTSSAPSNPPTELPSLFPSSPPSVAPSNRPSASPSVGPSSIPSSSPSVAPSNRPSASPSVGPSSIPSSSPSIAPSKRPSASPSVGPSSIPVPETCFVLHDPDDPAKCCFCMVTPDNVLDLDLPPLDGQQRRHLRHPLPDHAWLPVDWQQASLPAPTSSSGVARALADESAPEFSAATDPYATGVCPQPCERINVPRTVVSGPAPHEIIQP